MMNRGVYIDPKRARIALVEKGISAADLARQLEIYHGHLYGVLQRRVRGSEQLVARMAHALGVTFNFLIGEN